MLVQAKKKSKWTRRKPKHPLALNESQQILNGASIAAKYSYLIGLFLVDGLELDLTSMDQASVLDC